MLSYTWDQVLMSSQKNYMIYLILIKKLEKCDIDLLLADDSTKYALGRINNVMSI
jgi:hypothetical protein